MATTITTLTVDADKVTTTVHATEDEAYEALRVNFFDDLPADVGHDTLIEVATRSLCFWIEEHTVEVASDEVIPADLRLSFTPDAIREHFDGDEPDPTEGLTDEELAEVGRNALCDDVLYKAFHGALLSALGEED